MITRVVDGAPQILLFRHPSAGIQFPAGTVEPGESADDAVLREAIEETDLFRFAGPVLLEVQEDTLTDNRHCVCRSSPLLHRADSDGATWGDLPRGIVVTERDREAGFLQISYEERDLTSGELLAAHVGWVDAGALGRVRRRSFYHLRLREPARETWWVQTDGHRFELFWADPRLPATRQAIVAPQQTWLDVLLRSESFTHEV
ncbi:MAG: NUDIX domain-containing protein [Pseudomonadota bacterium]